MEKERKNVSVEHNQLINEMNEILTNISINIRNDLSTNYSFTTNPGML